MQPASVDTIDSAPVTPEEAALAAELDPVFSAALRLGFWPNSSAALPEQVADAVAYINGFSAAGASKVSLTTSAPTVIEGQTLQVVCSDVDATCEFWLYRARTAPMRVASGLAVVVQSVSEPSRLVAVASDESGAVVAACCFPLMLASPPRCRLVVDGQPHAGQVIRVASGYSGGTEGASSLVWTCRTPGELEKVIKTGTIGENGLLELLLDDSFVGSLLQVAYTPVRCDGLRGPTDVAVFGPVLPARPVLSQISVSCDISPFPAIGIPITASCSASPPTAIDFRWLAAPAPIPATVSPRASPGPLSVDDFADYVVVADTPVFTPTAVERGRLLTVQAKARDLPWMDGPTVSLSLPSPISAPAPVVRWLRIVPVLRPSPSLNSRPPAQPLADHWVVGSVLTVAGDFLHCEPADCGISWFREPSDGVGPGGTASVAQSRDTGHTGLLYTVSPDDQGCYIAARVVPMTGDSSVRGDLTLALSPSPIATSFVAEELILPVVSFVPAIPAEGAALDVTCSRGSVASAILLACRPPADTFAPVEHAPEDWPFVPDAALVGCALRVRASIRAGAEEYVVESAPTPPVLAASLPPFSLSVDGGLVSVIPETALPVPTEIEVAWRGQTSDGETELPFRELALPLVQLHALHVTAVSASVSCVRVLPTGDSVVQTTSASSIELPAAELAAVEPEAATLDATSDVTDLGGQETEGSNLTEVTEELVDVVPAQIGSSPHQSTVVPLSPPVVPGTLELSLFSDCPVSISLEARLRPTDDFSRIAAADWTPTAPHPQFSLGPQLVCCQLQCTVSAPGCANVVVPLSPCLPLSAPTTVPATGLAVEVVHEGKSRSLVFSDAKLKLRKKRKTINKWPWTAVTDITASRVGSGLDVHFLGIDLDVLIEGAAALLALAASRELWLASAFPER
jgi:hypothetical protein